MSLRRGGAASRPRRQRWGGRWPAHKAPFWLQSGPEKPRNPRLAPWGLRAGRAEGSWATGRQTKSCWCREKADAALMGRAGASCRLLSDGAGSGGGAGGGRAGAPRSASSQSPVPSRLPLTTRDPDQRGCSRLPGPDASPLARGAPSGAGHAQRSLPKARLSLTRVSRSWTSIFSSLPGRAPQSFGCAHGRTFAFCSRVSPGDGVSAQLPFSSPRSGLLSSPKALSTLLPWVGPPTSFQFLLCILSPSDLIPPRVLTATSVESARLELQPSPRPSPQACRPCA